MRGLNASYCQAAIRDTINGLSQLIRLDKEDEVVIECRVQIIRSILDHTDLTLDSPIDYRGSTVLMCVVEEGLYNFAKILLQRERVNVNVLNSDGQSALWYAIGSSDDGSPPWLDDEQVQSMTKLLLSHGAIPGGMDEQPVENVHPKAISTVRFKLAIVATLLQRPMVSEFIILLLINYLTS
ncbi:hypothetical protein N7493_001642 [Penicillium malachiteum]|uniref:Uncharacterized protein n=1 Tax=Penicillium malachiteum TaxID=1324776 RepID=A0AAD6HUJ6_9EURO|nr:hypothetical protein N7493_001642 [Penicillium malachiteum]